MRRKMGHSAPKRVLVIGLDGATFDLIKPWVEEGYLPTFKKLLREGAHGDLRSTIPPMTAPAWTSFATGTNPGQHRLYDWVAREKASYIFTPITAKDNKSVTLYTMLSRAGYRVCAMNIPMTYPPIPVNGVMISGLPAPEVNKNIFYPASLLDDIEQHVGPYELYPDPGQAYSESGIDAFLSRLYHCADVRMRTFDYLLSKEAWDFGMVVFNGTDTISHAMWKFMDRAHPLHNPEQYEKYGHAIREYYQYIDAYLAQVVASLDENTVLMLMSDHGFGPFHKFIHVNNWLRREGFMTIKSTVLARTKERLFDWGFSPMNIYNCLMKLGLGGLKSGVVRGNGQGLLKTVFLSFADVDWSKTAVYSLGNVGQICLNVKGREPFGCVEPGAEYEAVRHAVIDRLWQLRDPETGEQVVEAVYKREEVYSGAALTHAPDIVFMPRRLEYFGFGEYEFGSHQIIEPMKRGISGTHRMNGIFTAYGAGIIPGKCIADATLLDLAPTILHLMGVEVPEHIDGRILHDIFETAFQPETVTAVTDLSLPNQENSSELTEEEADTLSARLRELGYVG